MERNINAWSINPKIYSFLNYSVLRDILNSGQERFKETSSELKDIRNRAFTLIAILISFLGFLISAVVNKVYGLKNEDFKVIYLLLLCTLVITIWKSIDLIQILYPKQKMIIGEEPKSIDFNTMSTTNFEFQEFAYLINCLENIQYKIEFNERLIQKELRITENVIRVITISYVIVLVISIFSIIF